MNSKTNPAETTIARLRHVVQGSAEVVCGPLNGFGMFGWKMEAGDSPYPDSMQGDTDYGVAYLKHMIGQGFSVAFAAWKRPGRILVCLKAWEPGDDEPAWPMDTSDAEVIYHS